MSKSSYVNITDPNFYNFIKKRYAKYKIPSVKKTLKEICFPQKYSFQIPQLFLADLINPLTPYRGMLIYHRIGAGKTCTAIKISEKCKSKLKIMIVLPASLKDNFRAELRSPCGENNYITDKEIESLKRLDPSSDAYKDIIEKSNNRIEQIYTIYSYNKFADLCKNSKINLANTLLIIDEVHNMISETGIYYDLLYDIVHKSPKSTRLVIMSATPIFDKPIEIALTMNLLLQDQKLPTGPDFVNTFMDITYTETGPVYKVKNMDLFKNLVKGYVSYYRGAPPYTFPRSELNIVKTRMSEKAQKLYRKIIRGEVSYVPNIDYVNNDISNSFFIGTRMISNFVFPNGKIGKAGYDSLKESDLSIKNIGEFSPKFLKILRKIKKCEGTVFVYSNFKEYGGIKTFVRLLEHHHFKNYETNGIGSKRFAIWSGDQKPLIKEEIKNIFNAKKNSNGSDIKVILGSPSIKEGVTLLRVQEVHIIDVYWNMSRIFQIIGRAIRFCSHKDMPLDKQLVKVYIYLAVHPKIKRSVDEHIFKIATIKERVNKEFETALKEAAVDCELFKNANVYPGEGDIQCKLD